MFSLFKKHQYISRAIVGLVLALTLIAPLGAPVMALAEETTAATNVPATQPPGLDFGCSPLSLGGCIPAAAWGVMTITARIATLTSYALNYAMQKLVVGMGPLVNGMNGINIAWRTVRDLVNVMLVFLTIFIGIATIIGISGYGYKQLLWKVILASLFVNFSITFTKFIIDVSNIFAIETYKEILTAGQEAGGSNPVTCTTIPRDPLPGGETIPEECMNKGIAGTFFNEMKLTTLYSKEALGTTEETITDTKARSRFFWIAIFGSVFLLIAAFVFGAAAFFIIVRLAILIMLIILSPIGLVAWITGVSGIGREWWHKLLNQSFFLPIMMIFWLISLRVMQGMNTSLGSGSGFVQSASVIADGAQAPSASNLEGALAIIVYFFIISAFLIASLVAAKNLGAYGATAAINTGKSWSRKAGMAVGAGTVGAAAYAGRRTIGAGAERLSNSETLKDAVSHGGFIKRNLARGARKATQGVAQSNFDARTLAGKDAQKWVGKPKEGGYKQWQKDQEKKIKEEKEWVEKPTATLNEKKERDTAVQSAESEHADILAGGTRGEQAKEKLENEVAEAKKKREALEGTAAITEAETELKKLTEVEAEAKKIEEALKNAKTMDERSPLYEKQRQLEATHGDLKNLGTKKEAAQRRFSEATANRSKAMKSEEWKKADNQVRQAETDLGAVNGYYNSHNKIEDLRLNIAAAKKAGNLYLHPEWVEEEKQLTAQLQKSMDTLEERRARKGNEADKAYLEQAKIRGKNRGGGYLNNMSKSQGAMMVGGYSREFIAGLRGPTGNAKKINDFEKFLKDNYNVELDTIDAKAAGADAAKGSSSTDATEGAKA